MYRGANGDSAEPHGGQKETLKRAAETEGGGVRGLDMEKPGLTHARSEPEDEAERGATHLVCFKKSFLKR